MLGKRLPNISKSCSGLPDSMARTRARGRGEEAVSFAQALAEVRTQAEGELSGNAFDLASIIFDDLANLSPSSASAPQEHAREPVAEPAPHFSEPASETPAESARTEAALSAASFNEVGAASKARVEEVAASLGIGIARPFVASPSKPGDARRRGSDRSRICTRSGGGGA